MKAIWIAAAMMAWAPGVPARAQPQAPQPAGDAIVPDAEFEAALPKVGDDPNAPLAPLESFDTPGQRISNFAIHFFGLLAQATHQRRTGNAIGIAGQVVATVNQE